MGIGKKFDYPPLLGPGRHIMTMEEARRLIVERFPGNLHRAALFALLEQFVSDILEVGIPCEVWVNGSLVTEKEQPADVDVTVIVDPDVGAGLSDAQKALFDKVTDGYASRIDSFAYVRRDREDPYFMDPYIDNAYSWGEQYGLESSDEWLKGFVVILMGETDVGLRIRR
jgi:hypothetical protein